MSKGLEISIKGLEISIIMKDRTASRRWTECL